MTFSKLGTDIDTGQLVYLPKTARLQGLYIIGIQGTGKSGLIENLIMEDIKQQVGVCVLDPHGTLIDNVIARLPGKPEEDKVILLDLANYNYPFGLNLFACSDLTNPLVVEKTVNQVMHVFEKLLGVSTDTPLILQYLRNCTYTLVANPGYTMAEIPLLLQDDQCRRTLLAQVTDPNVLLFWKRYERMKPSEQDVQAASILRRVEEFLQILTRNIVGQSNTTFSLQDSMDTGKILLVKLSRQLEKPSNLIGSTIIAQLLNAAYARPVNKRKQFHLYADEFQNFATEDFATLLEEARKFGIGTTIAHQNRGQLNSANSKLETDLKDRSRSVANLIMFKINSKDADDLAGEFDCSPPPPGIIGQNPIKTPIKNVIKALLDGGQHKSDVVNTFVQKTLKPFDPRILSELNTFLYEQMTNYDPLRFVPLTYDRSYDQQQYHTFLYLLESMIKRNLPYNRHGSYPIVFLNYSKIRVAHPFDYQVSQKALYQMWVSAENSPSYQQAQQTLDAQVKNIMRASRISSGIKMDLEAIEKLVNGRLPYGWHTDSGKYGIFQVQDYFPVPTDWKTFLRQGNKIPVIHNDMCTIPSQTWYSIDFDALQWKTNPPPDKDIPAWEHDFQLCSGQAEQITQKNSYSLEQIIEADLQPERAILQKLLRELKAVCQALANDPIRVDSGLYEPIPDKPRQFADVKNDIANQLTGLPSFTARVKIATNAPQNPGKKCLSCGNQYGSGAMYCAGCGVKLPAPNEYTLATIKPAAGIATQQLQQRIAIIQARNLQQGYLRDRATVEAEITQRQTGCSGGSAPAQPQSPPQQPRHARQVPVQTNCPNCGASNPSGAKFCNQCGTQL